MNPSPSVCDVQWTIPRRRQELLNMTIPKGSCVYAITVKTGESRGMLRIVASGSYCQRARFDFTPMVRKKPKLRHG